VSVVKRRFLSRRKNCDKIKGEIKITASIHPSILFHPSFFALSAIRAPSRPNVRFRRPDGLPAPFGPPALSAAPEAPPEEPLRWVGRMLERIMRWGSLPPPARASKDLGRRAPLGDARSGMPRSGMPRSGMPRSVDACPLGGPDD
jgi:hypothetical protein